MAMAETKVKGAYMDKNKILKHFATIGSGTLINMVIGVITTPLITRLVDPTEYGQLSIFTMYSSIAVMVLCLGLDQALVRYYYDNDTMEYRRALLLKCIVLPVVITLAVSCVVIALSVTGAFKFEFDTFIMVLLCFYTFVEVVNRVSYLLIRLSYNSKLYAMLGIIKKSLYVILAAALLFIINGKDIEILVISTTVAAVAVTAVSIFNQRDIWNLRIANKDDCHVTQKELLRYAYPYIFSLGITTFFQAIDKMSLNYYCSYSEVGIYSSTMNLVHVFAIIQTTFNALYAPMAVEHYTKDKDDRRYYQKANQMMTVIMFFIGISLILCKDIFALLLGEKYREAATILPFLIFNPIMYTISETTVQGIVFMKKSKMQVAVAVFACVANLIGNTILVPIYGCQGAAISTGLSYIVFFTARTFISNRYFKVDFKLGKFYLLTAVVCGYAYYNTFFGNNFVSAIYYVGIVILMFIMYRKTVIEIIQYGLDFLKSLKSSRGKV